MEFKGLEPFVKRIEGQLGQASNMLLKALGEVPPVSVRFNPAKPVSHALNVTSEVPWCNDGVFLAERPVFTLDPLFHAGCYYPQEASSMIIRWVLSQVSDLPENPKVLDLCAAPGGKSTLIASWLAGKGLLVANEVVPNRAVILRENIVKWGFPNCVVTKAKPADFNRLASFFDLMVVDAPCSGEGMFRKDKQAIEHWSESIARMCATRQREILKDAWPTLKDGGWMIYSTCTFNPAENEENIAWLADWSGAEVFQLAAPSSWNVDTIPVGSGNALALYPHKVKGEGFFVALIRKPDGQRENQQATNHNRKLKEVKPPQEVNNLLQNQIDWDFYPGEAGWQALPAGYGNEVNKLKSALKMLHLGVALGQPVKHHWVPAPGLALSVTLNHDAFSSIELDLNDALRYLKGESLKGCDAKSGYFIVKYKGIPLGFVKNIGSRMNNLFPAEWRVRMQMATISSLQKKN